MGELPNVRFELRATAFAGVDVATGVIRGVSVISVGPAKGHGLQIDRTTLEQVKKCAETYGKGLKVKMSHAGDAGDIVGFLSAFRIEGDKLLADLTLLQSSQYRAYVLELAQTIPDTFGLSIAFSGPVETQGKTRFARCSEIYSADLVSEPAANPTGLFEAKPASASGDKPEQTKPNTKMDDTKLAEFTAALSSLSARLEKIEKAAPAAPAAETATAQFKAEISQALELASQKGAETALKAFAAKFGTPPAAPSGEGKPPVTQAEKKFEELVIEHPDYAKNKAFAITDTVSKNPAKHAEYVARLNARQDVRMF